MCVCTQYAYIAANKKDEIRVSYPMLERASLAIEQLESSESDISTFSSKMINGLVLANSEMFPANVLKLEASWTPTSSFYLHQTTKILVTNQFKEQYI